MLRIGTVFFCRKHIYRNGTVSIHRKKKHDDRKLNLVCKVCGDEVSFIDNLESHMGMGHQEEH